jgi:colanic acid/amylovoran biosynthesis glycosyltransferase
MRVAFFVDEFPALSETFVLDQITGLITRGCDVHVYARHVWPSAVAHPDVVAYRLVERASQLCPPPAPSTTARVVSGLRDIGRAVLRNPRLAMRSLNPLRFGREAVRLRPFYRVAPFLGGARYDVVHCHFGPNGVLAAELRDLGAFDAPIVTQFHGYDASSYVRRWGPDVYARLFERGDRFLCVSRRIQRLLVDLGCDEGKTRIHHTGVRVAQIPFVRRAPAPGERIRLLTVGRLVEKKGVEFSLRAVASLIPEYPNLVYTIVGDGPERDRLAALANDLSLGEHVQLVGAKLRGEVARLMQEAHIFLASSVSGADGDEEGIPVVLMEALASGVPVVSTTHAGIPELVVHGTGGLLAPERDSRTLAQHIRFLVTHPREREAMVLAGRKRVEAEYDSERLNERLLVLYDEVCGRTAAPRANPAAQPHSERSTPSEGPT